MAYEVGLEALADPTRRAIFESLRDGPRSVGDIARGVPVSRPAVSQHLRVLKEAGLVEDRRDGTRRLYAIRLQGLAEVRAYVEGFWQLALGRFAEAADRQSKGTARKGEGT